MHSRYTQVVGVSTANGFKFSLYRVNVGVRWRCYGFRAPWVGEGEGVGLQPAGEQRDLSSQAHYSN